MSLPVIRTNLTHPTVRTNLGAPFPANVVGSGPITVNKLSGVWTVGYDVTPFSLLNPGFDPTTKEVLLYDPATKLFYNVLLANLFSSVTIREKLTADRTCYVRKDGDDAHDGKADSAAGGFLTIGKAMSTVAAIDAGGFTVTVQVRAGTYNEKVTLPNVVGFAGAGNLQLLGDLATPSNVVITQSGANAYAITGSTLLTTWDVKGFKLTVSGASSACMFATNASIRFDKIDFGTAGNWHILAQDHSNVQTFSTGSYNISGDAPFHTLAQQQSEIVTINTTVTSSGGTRTFSAAYSYVALGQALHRADGMKFGTIVTFNAANDQVSWAAHGLVANNPVNFYTDPGSTIGGGLTAGIAYYVKTVIDADHFTVSATPGGALLDITSNGTGTNRAFSASGTRYVVGSPTCEIITNGGGANYFPGTSPGGGPNYS